MVVYLAAVKVKLPQLFDGIRIGSQKAHAELAQLVLGWTVPEPRRPFFNVLYNIHQHSVGPSAERLSDDEIRAISPIHPANTAADLAKWLKWLTGQLDLQIGTD